MAGKLVLDAEIAQAIHQYLVLTGLSSAANAFQNDCESRKVKLKKSSSTTSKNKLEEYSTRKKKLLSHFEKGEAVQFLAIWNQLFPANDDRSEAVDVLEFYIRIYFATFPLRKSPAAKSEYREKIADLKSYLEEGAGSKLSDTPELVQYFALPYVNEPGKHPVFKELVQKKWAKGILEKLERQLSRQVLNDGEAKLIKWMAAYYQYAQQTQDSFISPALDASAAHCSDRSALEYRELQDDYYKLIDIAAELIDCLERSYQGKTISADYFADISSRLMESSVEAERRMQKSAAGSAKTRMKRNRSLKGRVDSKKKDSPIKKSESTGTLIPADPNARPSAKVEEDAAVDLVAQLNYTKIANQLIKNTTSRISTLLLHALRQQITRVGKAAAVRSVEMFAQKDVLMLKHRRNSVVAAIVNQGDAGNNVKEELGRFLNALASFRIGRDYLLSFSQGKELLTLLSAALKSKKLHHHAGDHSLAALQKLSLRSSVQKELISQGMLEWLAYVLDSKINAFALEYGCALLMNLCLNPVSNSTLGRVSIPLLNTISSLLRNDNKEICKYVNGVLYSVMCVGRVRARAKEIDLETQIKTKLDSAHCDDDIMQLPVVLKLFNSDCENHSTRRAAIAEGDNDPEEDYLEAEIESTDSVRVAVNELFGVRLLEMKFRLWNGDDKSATARCEASNIGRDEITAPPGTVPRRAPQLRKPTTVTVRRSLASVSRIASLSAESVCVPDRPTSISSQQTFILENDRRKPLVARNAFQSAAVNPPPQLQSAPKQNAKESGNRTAIKVPSRGMSEPRALKQSHVSIAELNKPGLNGSSSKSQSLLGAEEEPKADDFLPDVPVTSSFPRRIPENANTYEYVAAFGSRPKILRTPDKQRSKSTYALF